MFHDEQEIFGTGQVRSIQTMEFQQTLFPTTPQAAQEAGILYFDYLNHLYPPFVRIRYQDNGGVEIRALGITLLSFDTPRVLTGRDVVAIRYPIRAGALVQRAQRRTGELRFEIRPRRLVMAVEGYYSALIGPGGSEWRKSLFERTQGRIHLRVAEGFLDELAGRLAMGRRP